MRIFVILFALVVALALACPTHAQIYRVSATITITNAPTTNGQTLTVNSSTRTWTNNPALNPAIYIETNLTKNGSATNLFNHVATYRFVAPINTTWANTNAIKLQGGVGQSLTVTIGGGWASVSYSTQLVSTPFTVPVRVPIDVEPATNQTNIASMLMDGLNRLSTNRAFNSLVSTNATLINARVTSTNAALTNAVLKDPTIIGTIAQTFSNTLFSANGTNRVDGDWSWTMATLTTLTNASLDETNLAIGTNVYVRLTLTNTYTVRGIAGGRSGQMRLLWNPSGFSLVFTNESAAAPATSRILTLLGTNVVVTNGMALAIYDSTTNRWIVTGLGAASGSGSSGGGSASPDLPTGNLVWVDAVFGSDSTGTRTNAAKPFATTGAAKTNAIAGDTIVVRPGMYRHGDLLKNNVNWHFMNGAAVHWTNNTTVGIFDDGGVGANGAVTSNISGYGVFTNANASGGDPLIYLINGSQIRVQARVLESATDTIRAGHVDLFLTVEADTIQCTGASNEALHALRGKIVVNRARIKSTGDTAVWLNQNDLTILRDCVLIGDTNGTLSIDASVAVNVKLYGSTMANLTNGANVSFTTGGSRFDIDADVE